MIKFIEDKHASLLAEIKEKKTIESATDEKLRRALDEFKGIFTY